MGKWGVAIMAAAAGLCGYVLGFVSVVLWVVYFGFSGSVDEQKALSAKLEMSLSSHNACMESHVSLEVNYSELKRQKLTLQDLNTRLNGDIVNMKSQLRVKDDSLDIMKQELRRMRQKLQINIKQLDKLNNLVEAYEKRLTFLEKERLDYGTELEQRRRDVENLLNQISEMHTRFLNSSDVTDEYQLDWENSTVPFVPDSTTVLPMNRSYITGAPVRWPTSQSFKQTSGYTGLHYPLPLPSEYQQTTNTLPEKTTGNRSTS